MSFAIVVSLSLTSSLLAKEKDDDESSGDVKVKKLVLVRLEDDQYKPVKAYKPDEKLNVLVFVNEIKEGTTVKVVWTAVDAGEDKDKKLNEDSATIDAETLKNAKATDRVDFSLNHKNPLAPGDYKVDAYVNDELAKTAEFKVEE